MKYSALRCRDKARSAGRALSSPPVLSTVRFPCLPTDRCAPPPPKAPDESLISRRSSYLLTDFFPVSSSEYRVSPGVLVMASSRHLEAGFEVRYFPLGTRPSRLVAPLGRHPSRSLNSAFRRRIFTWRVSSYFPHDSFKNRPTPPSRLSFFL